MMVNLSSVDEETENETPVETPPEALEDDGKEDRVRVDRRKLEQMLQVNGDGVGSSADEFFTRVMHETGTRISWPSKLKIGAKSKKDPHIKIAGQPENIKKAKEMVIAVLESKANRVTLKMDVSHTDHSHIIGRRGQSIKRVMEETGCHIHFPDSNRGPDTTEKSNQVSIAGQPEGVEKARTRIRELLPLVLLFEVNNAYIPLDPLTPAVQNISQRYDVTFAQKGISTMGQLIISVRVAQDKVSNIQDAIGYLVEHLTGHFQVPRIVCLHLDIAPQHLVFVVGRAGCNIREIVSSTGAEVKLPDSSAAGRKGSFAIKGSFEAVIQARVMLVQLLPLLLMFDLKEEEAMSLDDKPDKLKKLMEKFNVTIMVKSKPKQSSKSVVIKSKEGNSQNMFLTRLEILGNPMDPLTTKHPLLARQSPEPAFMFPQPGMPWFTNIGQSPYSSPVASPTPQPPRSTDSPVAMHATPPPLRYPPGFEHVHEPSKSESFNNLIHRNRSFSSDADCHRSQRMAASEGGSPKQLDTFSFPRRNSEPTTLDDSWSKSKLKSSMDSSSSKQKYALMEGIRNAPKGHQLLDSHGSQPASSNNSLASSLHFSYNFDRCLDLTPQKKFVDYEKQVGKANQVMTKKVIQPQVRTPTDQWSGLHLSKSTPNGALRKPALNSPTDPHQSISSSNELSEPKDISPARQDFSASVHFPASQMSRRPFSSPTSESNNIDVTNQPVLQSGLYDILKLYGVEDYAKVFESQQIDFDIFLSLTKEDLKEAGVEPLGARKKMEHAIEDMKRLQEQAIKNEYLNKAQNFRVTNPLEFNSRSGRW